MDEYTFGFAAEDDFPALAKLWEQVFGDGEEFIGKFFASLWTPDCCRAAWRGCELAAMGFCLTGPTARDLKCGYIYAMATHPSHRGRGLAARIGRELVSSTFASGLDIVSTLPAEDSLNTWYETRLGMTPTFKKGGEGVVFPGNWLQFSKYCGVHDPETPNTLLAVARNGVDLNCVHGLGWECTFD